MALADTGGAAGMVATLVSLYGRADVPGRIALDNCPALGLGTGYTVWHLLPDWPTLEPLLTLLLDTPQFLSCSGTASASL